MSGRVVTDVVGMRLPDGTRLATEVIRRDGGPPAPALLVRTPYSRPAAREVAGAALGAGFTLVVQDVRGRWDSEGDFEPFTQERDDGAAAVAWCSRQPWCDGRVTMTGASYLGAAQWSAAAAAGPALQAINPLLAPCGPPERWLWQGGAFQVGMAAPWLLSMLASSERSSPQETGALAAAAAAWREPSTALADAALLSRSATYRRWRAGPATAEPAPVVTPAFTVVGWWDFFAESGLAAHARQAAAGVPVVTVVGPWAHDERLPDVSWEAGAGPRADADVLGLREEGLAWLAGASDGDRPEPELRYYAGDGRWCRTASWPPDTAALDLFPAAPGRLTPQPPEHVEWPVWEHDPQNPVPSRGGRTLGPFLPLPGPRDQRPLRGRPDLLVFTGEVLVQPLAIAGCVTADLDVASTATGVDVAVKLCDVQPDGTPVAVLDGIRRAGRPGRVHVEVGSIAYVFRAGHRIELEVAGSNFPRFDVHPPVRATHRLRCGGSGASRLTLPVARDG